MAIQFHKLKVKDIIRRTSKAVSVHFDIPESEKELWSYKAGQYITLKFDINDKSERRAYSLSTSPITDNEFGVTVKEVDGGIVSSYINQTLKAGETVDVMPPLGNFTTEIISTNRKNYVMWAGGSGITPIISLIKSILEVEKNSKVLLFYANLNDEAIIFKNELAKLAEDNSDRFEIRHILEEDSLKFAIFEGRLSSQKCINLLENVKSFNNAEHFMCGPGPMMDEISSALESLKVEKSKIHKELFTVAENQDAKISLDSSEPMVSGGPVKADVKVLIYGEEHTIEVNPDETILQAGIRQSLDPPFSCQIAACATCQAKVLNGSVEMEADDALTEDEIEDGYVLTCVAHPTSKNVTIDYDY